MEMVVAMVMNERRRTSGKRLIKEDVRRADQHQLNVASKVSSLDT